MALLSAAVITVANFKSTFDRDFIYGTALTTVRDTDIERAINESVPSFNPGLFDTLATQKVAFSYLAAHALVMNVKAAGGLKKAGSGINSTGTHIINSKGAGPLNVSYSVAQDLIDNPALAQYAKTEYGLKYIQLLVPNLIGNVGIAGGNTQS